jgi:ankyrin repeat domain-containing protein 50
MDAFSAAGSAVGVISLGLQVCQGLMQYYGTWKDGRQDISRMCKLVDSLADILNALKQSLEKGSLVGDVVDMVQGSVQACTDSILELQEELTRVQAIKGSSIRSKLHDQGRRLLYPFRESTLLKLKEIVLDIRDNLTVAVQALHL